MLPQYKGHLKININKEDWKLVIRFEEDYPDKKPWETEDLNLIEIDPKDVPRFCEHLLFYSARLHDLQRLEQQIMEETNFDKLYDEFEAKYNPYPVQMSRAEAFSKALRDGLISEEVYDAAHKYYKKLWFYVGD